MVRRLSKAMAADIMTGEPPVEIVSPLVSARVAVSYACDDENFGPFQGAGAAAGGFTLPRAAALPRCRARAMSKWLLI